MLGSNFHRNSKISGIKLILIIFKGIYRVGESNPIGAWTAARGGGSLQLQLNIIECNKKRFFYHRFVELFVDIFITIDLI